uniref:ATP synthase complex subunit 8 n=1 Tax=Neocucumis proteus TaxID=2576476 RepID=A0A8F6HAQ6_9ECHN|nr:ATP synthase F0 subunit 8 [Neocucumis proteus]
MPQLDLSWFILNFIIAWICIIIIYLAIINNNWPNNNSNNNNTQQTPTKTNNWNW